MKRERRWKAKKMNKFFIVIQNDSENDDGACIDVDISNANKIMQISGMFL